MSTAGHGGVQVEELAPLDQEGREDLERWDELGRRLRRLNPARYARLVARLRREVIGSPA